LSIRLARAAAGRRGLEQKAAVLARSRKAILAIVDQGVVSVLNVLTLVVIGRWSTATDLGVYSLAASVIVLLGSLVEALITGPYVVHLARMRDRMDHYTGSMVAHSAACGVLAASMLALVASCVGLSHSPSPIGGALWPLSAVAIPVIARETARRHAMAHNAPLKALVLDGGIAIAQMVLLALLAHQRAITSTSVLLALGLTSSIGALTYWVTLRRGVRFHREDVLADLRLNMQIAGWLFGSQMTMIAQMAAGQWAVALTQGAAETGRLTAAISVAMVANPVVTGFSNLYLPEAARLVYLKGIAALRRSAFSLGRVLAFCMLSYCVAMHYAGLLLMRLIYARHYVETGVLVLLLSVAFSARVIGMPVYIGLWVMHRSKVNFVINVISWAAIAGTIVALRRYGLAGAAIAIMSGEAATCAARWLAFRTWSSLPQAQTLAEAA
jgi:O-antigen/teichoic acid export membrane protein